MLLVPNWLSSNMAGLVWVCCNSGLARGCLGSIAGSVFCAPWTMGESFAPSCFSGAGFELGTLPTLLPKASSVPVSLSNPASGFCCCLGAISVFTGCFAASRETGTGSWGLLSCPLTTWLDSKSFFPSVFGLSLCWSGCGFSWASCEFWELKLFVLSGTLSGALGFASTYLFGGGGLRTSFTNALGAISMLNCRCAGFRTAPWTGSVRSRCGFSWASCEFWELKLFVLSGTLSGALGFASTYLFGGGGLRTSFTNALGAISILNCRCAGFRTAPWTGSVRSRYGAVANRRKWTSRTARIPIITERESGSSMTRAASRLNEAVGEATVSVWVIGRLRRALENV